MYYENIFGWFDFENLYQEAVERYDNCSFIEIGSFQGRSACFMAEYIKERKKNIQLICVDLWPDKHDLENLATIGAGQGAEGNIIRSLPKSLYDTFLSNLENAGVLHSEPFIVPMRMRSEEAARILTNQINKPTYNFIFVDASHSYAGCMADLVNYWPLVASGGMFCGHDYYHDVERAVLDFFRPLGITVERSISSWKVIKP